VPKFLEPHADMMRGADFKDEAKQAWNEYSKSEALLGYGDADDEEEDKRKGFGAKSAGPGGKAAAMAAALSGTGTEVSQEDKEEMAKREKGLGNRAFQEKQYDAAIKHFAVCIQLDPHSTDAHIFHSNRSAAYASVKKYSEALEDAQKATEVRPEWAKGFARKGAALMGLERFLDAKGAYLEAFTLDPENVTYEAFAINAQQAEDKALDEGRFTFRAKKRPPQPDDASASADTGEGEKAISGNEKAPAPPSNANKRKVKRRVAVDAPRAGAVNNSKLLSFGNDDDENDDENE